MDYLFYINDLQIKEPIGWDDFELSINRDEKTHGIQFEASTGVLKFHGNAVAYLEAQKDQYGIKADVVFTAQQFCNDPYAPVEQITGRLNFGKYKKRCGRQCVIELPLEEDGCKVTFKSRYDQKVDLDKLVAFDGMTPLANYAQLGQELTLHAKALQSSVDGRVADAGFTVEYDAGDGFFGSLQRIRPDYEVERYNNIATGQLQSVSSYICNDGNCGSIGPLTPQLLFDDTISCFDGNFEYSVRKKGTLTVTDGGSVFYIKMLLFTWDGNGDIFVDADQVQEQMLADYSSSPVGNPTVDFDGTINGITTLAPGVGLYAVLEIGMGSGTYHIKVDFKKQTYFTVNAIKLCPDTQVQYYMLHETLSRVVESITNNCVRVKSSYYGRTDSQPFAFDTDGCGGLRMLTSGLKIRRAPDGKFFTSVKELFEGLNPIDNIGFDITPDEDLPGMFVMNIEGVDFFYRNQEVLLLDNIPDGTVEVQEQMHYSKIDVGYKKWEVEGINGLDEFNSTREYRTSFDTISNTLDITSALITGSYPIEHTRQQNLADSGAADTKFDNDTFLITLKRLAYTFEVEQDNVSNPLNFFDPATTYNFRLSPIRNLMRWYKTIAAGYTQLNDSDNKLFFNAGTGNFLASGEIITGAYDGNCKLEAMPIVENQNLFVTHFARQSDYMPIWEPEVFSFEYPLSIANYKALKANPYGYITHQCGNGEFKKGFIKEIKFKPARGRATFALIKKRD